MASENERNFNFNRNAQVAKGPHPTPKLEENEITRVAFSLKVNNVYMQQCDNLKEKIHPKGRFFQKDNGQKKIYKLPGKRTNRQNDKMQ